MSAIELVIFGCEGVLVDSRLIAAGAQAEVLAAAGHATAPEELARLYPDMAFKDILLRIERETGRPFQASLIGEAETQIDSRLAAEARSVAGAAEAVAALTVNHCVCSNSGAARTEALLRRAGLLSFFEGRIFSLRDMPEQGPARETELFLHAARAMRTEPGNSLVVEDTAAGMAGARAAGMRAIGFVGGAHTHPGHADLLTEAGAETVIRRWSDLRPVLEALAVWSEDDGF